MKESIFYKLEKEKQELVFTSSLLEFSNHQYKFSNLIRISDKTRIPKCSLYQYFENKSKLYEYTVSKANNTKIDFIKSHLKNNYINLCDQIYDIVYWGGIFFKTHSKYSLLIQNCLDENNSEIAHIKNNIKNTFFHLIKDAIIESEIKMQIKPKNDLFISAHIISATIQGIPDYFKFKYGIDVKEHILKGNKTDSITEEQIVHMAKNISNIISNGISTN